MADKDTIMFDIKTKTLKKPTHEGENKAVKDLKKTAESGTNSYSSYNKKMISALKTLKKG